MLKFKNKKIYSLLIVMAMIIFLGSSYAFINFTLTGTKTYSIVGGELKLILDDTDNNLIIGDDDALPIPDYQGLEQDGYNFTLKNQGKADMAYYVYIDNNQEENLMADEAIKYALTKNGDSKNTIGLVSDLENRLLTNGRINKDMEIKYNLKFWIDINATNEQVVGKVFSVKLRVVGEQIVNLTYQDNSGANEPIISTGMIPVTYNGVSWVKADVASEWYNYDQQWWANAVTVASDRRDEYVNAPAGSPIDIADINTMWVWIPRYEYETFTSKSATEIKVKFITGTEKNVTSNYYTHPAFTFGSDELTGIWVAKFEASSDKTCTATTDAVDTGCDLTTLKVNVKPNATSWRYIRVSTADLNSRAMNDDGNIYGFLEDEVDTHMMKNMEWGAAAYLTQSKYGKCVDGTCTEIARNNNANYITGYGSDIYTEEKGLLASTTGNIYGIYDMSGGSYEYVMGVIKDNTSDNPMSGQTLTINSGFTGITHDGGKYTNFLGRDFPESKYYDLYEFGTSYNDNLAYNRGKIGDATLETKNWYDDRAEFIYSPEPWMVRGGQPSESTYAGIFSFRYRSGSSIGTGFRPVLVQK